MGVALKDEFIGCPHFFLMPLISTKTKFESFLAIKSNRELAEVLELKYKHLMYYTYVFPSDKKYIEFEIKKRRGGTRKIVAPIPQIKAIQSRINKILQEGFKQKSCVHGYLYGKSIVSNAREHVNKRIIVNIDLKDYFPSINFGRVRGLFMSYPFNFNNAVASLLSNLCCHSGHIPQGAPTSPIISNYICRRLDNDIIDIVLKEKVKYSRYADDITFSTNLKTLPSSIGIVDDNKLILSPSIVKAIEKNGFTINNEKTRFSTKSNRQEVTGLIINKKVNVKRTYVRHIRAMLNAWEKFGIDLAAIEHFKKYNYKFKSPSNLNEAFQKEILGKIGFVGFVRGKDDLIYKKLAKRIKLVSPEVKLSVIRKDIETETLPIIYGEGKTDWKHLKAALSKFQRDGKYIDLEVRFREYDDEFAINNAELLAICKALAKTSDHKNVVICLFDRDDKLINTKVTANSQPFKHWGNRVYSLLLGQPSHRSFEQICIEHYYLDSEIKTMDTHKRRLYLADEFTMTGIHHSEKVKYMRIKRLLSGVPFIIDSDVLNEEEQNIALPKNLFSEYILTRKESFNNFTFEYFASIFENIKLILDHDGANSHKKT